jgi:hypothetical protein
MIELHTVYLTVLLDCMCVVTLDDRFIMNVELGRTWKEGTVTCFKRLSQLLPQGSEGES